MKLASVLSPHFDSDVRARGASYYRLGAVRIKRGNATGVEAGVRGSRVYDVEIAWDGSRLALFCDCPYYQDVGACKHLWATILAADSQNYFTAITRLNPRDISFDETADDDDDEDDPFEGLPHFAPVARPDPVFKLQIPAAPPSWLQRLNEIVPAGSLASTAWPAQRELLYIVDAAASVARGSLVLELKTREPKLKGGWKKPGVPQISRAVLSVLPNPADRHILGLLSGSAMNSDWLSYSSYESIGAGFRLRHPFAATVMPDIARTGRCLLQLNSADQEWLPLQWDDGEPWRFVLRLLRQEGHKWALAGWLRRGGEEMDLLAPLLISEGLVFTRERVALLEEGTPFEWIASLRRLRHIDAPEGDIGQMLAALLEHPLAARIEVPDELRYEEVQPVPKPCLTFRSQKRYEWEREHLHAEISFDYDGRRVPDALKSRGMYDPANRRYVVRDLQAEAAAKAFVYQLGLEELPADYRGEAASLRLAPKKLPAVAHACLAAGWHVEAEGKIFRRPGAMHVGVSSGIDWFELHGEVDYGGATAKLPALLAALRRGENMVRLDDGTYGLLPEEWLTRFGTMAGLGTAEAEHLRFRRNQAGLLDALLAAQPEVTCDETFARVRERDCAASRASGRASSRRASWDNCAITSATALGWMEFLREFGFGGCLADDMGVGKTAQVLAMLETRGAPQDQRAVAGGGAEIADVQLAQEAARFTPRLRVLDHTGTGARRCEMFARSRSGPDHLRHLLRDAAELTRRSNSITWCWTKRRPSRTPRTESAKAVRLLRGTHRLALSGTPVENHLGELWSLFEFLNPGMLGAAQRIASWRAALARNPSEETRSAAGARAAPVHSAAHQAAGGARAAARKPSRPSSASWRPRSASSTTNCACTTAIRCCRRVTAQGLAQSKIQVLEALLRLRQAACHPGLIDPKRVRRAQRQAGRADGRTWPKSWRRATRRWCSRSSPACWRSCGERLDDDGVRLRVPGRRDARPAGARGAFPERPGLRAVPDQPEGRRPGPEPDRGRVRFPAGSLVESGGGSAGRGPRAPHRPDAAGVRLPADRARHRGREDAAIAKTKRDLADAIISEDNSLIRDLKREDLELLLS